MSDASGSGYASVISERENLNYSARDVVPRPNSKMRQNELMGHLCDRNNFFTAV